LINAEPVSADAPVGSPLEELHARVEVLRQQVRRRFRERDARVGIDPKTPAHIVDAADQQLEKAVERVATMISEAQAAAPQPGSKEYDKIVRSLDHATGQIEQAFERSDGIPIDGDGTTEPAERRLEQSTREVDDATQHVEHAVERVETVIASTRTKSDAIESTDPEMRGKRADVGKGDGSTSAPPTGAVEHAQQVAEQAKATGRRAHRRRGSKKPKRGGGAVANQPS
jgi:hypothetical protein